MDFLLAFVRSTQRKEISILANLQLNSLSLSFFFFHFKNVKYRLNFIAISEYYMWVCIFVGNFENVPCSVREGILLWFCNRIVFFFFFFFCTMCFAFVSFIWTFSFRRIDKHKLLNRIKKKTKISNNDKMPAVNFDL